MVVLLVCVSGIAGTVYGVVATSVVVGHGMLEV